MGTSSARAALVASALTVFVHAGRVHADPVTFQRTTVSSSIVGAAFVVAGDVAGDVRPEIVASGFGAFGFVPGVGPIPPVAGTVTLFRNTFRSARPGGDLGPWAAVDIVTPADGITFPNKPTLADVDGDGDTDVIVPGGYFFDTFIGQSRGSITWWENRANGNTWVRHDVVTGTGLSYHAVAHADLDGDGLADLVTVGEAGGNPSNATDDVVELQYLRGLGGGSFSAPIRLGTGGGSLLVVYDVNGDGRLDVVSPQFFGPVAGQPFVPVFARNASVASFVWFEQGGAQAGALSEASFTRHAIGTAQGPGFSIVPVANLRGDGVTRWVATNHTNPNIAFPPFALYPEPAVYEFTPGTNPAQPWSVVRLSAPGSFPVTGGPGQAAPGAVGAADLDGDGDLDLAVSGDGSRTVYWLEQRADGSFLTHALPDATGYGQAGGPALVDLNRDGRTEIVFGSFDQNSLSFWHR